MQISIDNVMPDDVSKKSLKVLDKKLQMLAEHADFHVNINSVLGGGIHNPEDALTIGKRALELGFTSTVGIIHDGDGQLKPLGGREREIFSEMKTLEKKQLLAAQLFSDDIAQGRRTTGAAAPEPAICTSARTAWCTTAPSSAAIRANRWNSTPPRISAANTTQ